MSQRSTSLAFLVLFGAVLAVSGCGGRQPQVKVIGISEPPRRAAAAESLVLFLEVVNPTPRDLRLARIEYRIDAESWFATRGRFDLSRAVSADSVAVVEIPIPVERAARAGHQARVPYRFEGRLYTVEEQVERSWRVRVEGTIDAAPIGSARARAFGRVATTE